MTTNTTKLNCFCCHFRRPTCCCCCGGTNTKSSNSTSNDESISACADCCSCMMSPNISFCSHSNEEGVNVESYSLIPGCAKKTTTYDDNGMTKGTEQCCGFCNSSSNMGSEGVSGESNLCCCSYKYDAQNFSMCPCFGDSDFTCNGCHCPSSDGVGNCYSEQLSCDCCSGIGESFAGCFSGICDIIGGCFESCGDCDCDLGDD